MTSRTRSRALAALTWAIVVLSLAPIAWMLLASVRQHTDIAAGVPWDSAAPLRFENYRDIWINVDFFGYFLNSLIVCGLTTLIATTIALGAAYALARFRFRG